MTVKEYLGQAYRLSLKIDSNMKKMAYLRDVATRGTSRWMATQQSGTEDRSFMENSVIKLVDLERLVMADEARLARARQRAAALIRCLPEGGCRKLLTLRYVDCREWLEIALNLGLCWERMHRLHSKALATVKACLLLRHGSGGNSTAKPVAMGGSSHG